MLSGGMLGRFCEPNRAETSRGERTKVETLEWRQKALLPCFLPFPIFLVPRLDPLLVFDGLAVLFQRGTKNTDYTWISLATAYLHDLMVVYLTDARLTTVTSRECYASWGFIISS